MCVLMEEIRTTCEIVLREQLNLIKHLELMTNLEAIEGREEHIFANTGIQ